MSKILFEGLLASLKKSNKARRQIAAEKAGYKSYEEYKKWLEIMIQLGAKDPATEVATAPSNNPTIHVVDILDCSGSMKGPKLAAAERGIKEGIVDLRHDKTKVDYTYTLCDFSSSNDIQVPYFMSTFSEVGTNIKFTFRGMTALYDAIGTMLHKLEESVPQEDTVLVNIYTDGGENASTKYTARKVASLIERLKEDRFTVTFIGTESDTRDVINILKVDGSNTRVYDGTASGFSSMMEDTKISRRIFSASVKAGENVTKGFYKNIKK